MNEIATAVKELLSWFNEQLDAMLAMPARFLREWFGPTLLNPKGLLNGIDPNMSIPEYIWTSLVGVVVALIGTIVAFWPLLLLAAVYILLFEVPAYRRVARQPAYYSFAYDPYEFDPPSRRSPAVSMRVKRHQVLARMEEEQYLSQLRYTRRIRPSKALRARTR